MTDKEITNRLIHETSPYLLQHARNPVDWYPWGEAAFEKAKTENKLVLVSIGYSACHWCHVMEHESFEDDSVAALMNKHFICIKVDREERPDVDQIYMDAVQLMTGGGGWPLNCFTLPDGRPVYGGTYFPRDQWMKVLVALEETWREEPEKFEAYAARLTEGVQQTGVVEVQDELEYAKDSLDAMVTAWKQQFDKHWGGPNRAPKFPMPNNYAFLMQYASLTGDAEVMQHVDLTLERMATGGMYDQIGGGFARYSVDTLWKIPHFEKMLYDNGQLLSLYSKAYQRTSKPIYERVIRQTAEWLAREMSAENGAFYSALDADSEGEEGKFYVWTKAEWEQIFPDDHVFVAALYNEEERGYWEDGKHVLMRRSDEQALREEFGLTPAEFEQKVRAINEKLMDARFKRPRPGLDDKSLTSWNALAITGLCDAYNALGEAKYLDMAAQNARFLLEDQRRSDGGLYHTWKAGKSSINGYLEDYCFTAEAMIALYETTFDEMWLTQARELADYAIVHFSDDTTGMFHFTSDLDPPLIARKTEVHDNVVPASNSAMAKVLFTLGKLLHADNYSERAQKMLANVAPMMKQYPSGYSNWAQLMAWELYPFYEVVITGPEASDYGRRMREVYHPNRLVLGATAESGLPLFEGRFFEGQTTVFVCVDRACQMPVHSVDAALEQMKTPSP